MPEKKTGRFGSDVRALIDKYGKEMSINDIVGELEMVKWFLFNEALEDAKEQAAAEVKKKNGAFR